MNTFDPWHLVEQIKRQQALGASLNELQSLQLKFALQLDQHRPENGFAVLAAAVRCAANGIPAPDWLAHDLNARFQQVSGFTVRSLDDPRAFGPAPLRAGGGHLSTAAIRARWGQMLDVLFGPPAPLLRRTPEGRRKAAAMLGLTEKQVRNVLPKTRSNKKGHQPYSKPSPPSRAHDPFNLARKKEPES